MLSEGAGVKRGLPAKPASQLTLCGEVHVFVCACECVHVFVCACVCGVCMCECAHVCVVCACVCA